MFEPNNLNDWTGMNRVFALAHFQLSLLPLGLRQPPCEAHDIVLVLQNSLARAHAFLTRSLRSAAIVGNDCVQLRRVLARLAAGGVPEHLLLHHIGFAGILDDLELSKLVARMAVLATSGDRLSKKASKRNMIGPIMFVTPEVGKWSTVGGLGVMVDELACTLALPDFGPQEVWVMSPYYERNKRGETGYLAQDDITWQFNVTVDVGIEHVVLGVYEHRINNVRLFFMHNASYFPHPYPNFLYNAERQTAFLALMAKGPLEIACHVAKTSGAIPGVIVTNDWACGLLPAYARRGFFGDTFSGTKVLHIVHNLDISYEGRFYPNPSDDVAKVHQLPSELLTDPFWQLQCVNPSRCALLCCDSWATVSYSYRNELLNSSPLSPILRKHPHPFATPNGVPLEPRLARLNNTGCKSHEEAKALLQQRYFNMQHPDPEIALFAFVGRITAQKGVNLILEIVEELIHKHNGRVQILLAGCVNPGEAYSERCAHWMWNLKMKHPQNFWCDPGWFFTDGPLANLGADFALMPSLFEPGGIVQHEFFVAGTPVIAFKTGGLRDTVFEFYQGQGNGFTFEAHTPGDLMHAVDRALSVYHDKQAYAQLRSHARGSVRTLDMVGRAWLKEFYRLRGKVYVDAAIMKADMQLLEVPPPPPPQQRDRASCSAPPSPASPNPTSAFPPSSSKPLQRCTATAPASTSVTGGGGSGSSSALPPITVLAPHHASGGDDGSEDNTDRASMPPPQPPAARSRCTSYNDVASLANNRDNSNCNSNDSVVVRCSSLVECGQFLAHLRCCVSCQAAAMEVLQLATPHHTHPRAES
eukprot:gnl/Spiro4/25087_TR12486_c0_g1_i1.p1 gnl/Spiro4/25087_TR12486_c0_g1~~gnl/Spiro4/25087_TR12486_c0_g1_i1.p1  ORF type:complete len:812 (+),score=206.86 gnl/Spiro4/25087_TR12486_c0_g1_i1:60-2495(+)